MTDPTPRDSYRPNPAPSTVDRDPMTVTYVAKLLAEADAGPRRPRSWSVTHGLGKPAAGTYTEVRFAFEAIDDLEQHLAYPEAVVDEVVRRVARDLYGTAWAFHYRPDQYADAIDRYGMRRREVVVVESVEVYA